MININNLQKYYTGFSDVGDRIISGLSLGFIGGKIKYKALTDINLSIKGGEVIGLIGRNGAGKSTLLKIISGVAKFQKGEMNLGGEVRAILELGVGFNPELSGKENIHYNGLVWGYSPTEIELLEDQIFDFAGLTEFKDIPLKSYSSGMIMRLGFALATAKSTEILLVDEALAVGDAGFQQKCINRFRDFKNQGSLILIVSHDLGLLKSICSRILVMEKGKIVFDGEPVKAYEYYMDLIAKNSFVGTMTNYSDYLQKYTVEIIFNGYSNPAIIPVGGIINLKIKLIFRQDISDLTIGFHIDDAKGIRIFGTNSYHLGKKIVTIAADESCEVVFQFPLNFSSGKYSLGIALHEGDSHATKCYLWRDNLLQFEIENVSMPKFEGTTFLPVELFLQEVDSRV